MNEKITQSNVYLDGFAPNYKSKIVIGNITMLCLKKFNWLQRKMLNVFFGFEVSNLEKEVK